ncbi:MAG: tyrosine/phenylalanine carboxypeptidase domain-containing protein [Candidatus Nanoarchaeia archaeon]
MITFTDEHIKADNQLLKYRIEVEEFLESSNLQNKKKQFLKEGVEPELNDFIKDNSFATKCINEIEQIIIPNDEIGTILQKIKDFLLIQYHIIKHRGTSHITELSTILNDIPSQELVNEAKRILEKKVNIEKEYSLTPQNLKVFLEDKLKEYGLDDWNIELSDKYITLDDAPNKKILISKHRMFPKGDDKRLAVHEIGVHTLRCVNGLNQPLKNLGLGIPGYLATEEGLAALSEELSGCSDYELLRNYAGRVIAVNSIIENNSFTQTFDELKSHWFNDDTAWTLSVRAHRGGGYIKDHVYLKGYFEVKAFYEQGGDLNDLYVGKIALEDLKWSNKMIKEGFLKKPILLPFLLR